MRSEPLVYCNKMFNSSIIPSTANKGFLTVRVSLFIFLQVRTFLRAVSKTRVVFVNGTYATFRMHSAIVNGKTVTKNYSRGHGRNLDQWRFPFIVQSLSRKMAHVFQPINQCMTSFQLVILGACSKFVRSSPLPKASFISPSPLRCDDTWYTNSVCNILSRPCIRFTAKLFQSVRSPLKVETAKSYKFQ